MKKPTQPSTGNTHQTVIEINTGSSTQSIRIGFTDQRLTAYGGMACWSTFLCKQKVREQLQSVLPHAPTSPNAYEPTDVALGLMGGILCGADKLSRVAYLRQDPAMAEVLGIEAVASQSTFSRFLNGFDAAASNALNGLHRCWTCLVTGFRRWPPICPTAGACSRSGVAIMVGRKVKIASRSLAVSLALKDFAAKHLGPRRRSVSWPSGRTTSASYSKGNWDCWRKYNYRRYAGGSFAGLGSGAAHKANPPSNSPSVVRTNEVGGSKSSKNSILRCHRSTAIQLNGTRSKP
jgi:hypothetical protein